MGIDDRIKKLEALLEAEETACERYRERWLRIKDRNHANKNAIERLRQAISEAANELPLCPAEAKKILLDALSIHAEKE